LELARRERDCGLDGAADVLAISYEPALRRGALAVGVAVDPIQDEDHDAAFGQIVAVVIKVGKRIAQLDGHQVSADWDGYAV
jgi:hypothetical protein